MPSQGRPKVTVRVDPGERADGQWAAEVLGYESVASMLRQAHAELVTEAEEVSGDLRPSKR